MSVLYRFTARIPLQAPATAAQEDAIEALNGALGQCEDAAMRRHEDASQGCAWLDIHCPSQMLGFSFVNHLECLVAKLGPFATAAFRLDCQYGDEACGAEFFGPTEESIQEARRQWHCGKAAESLRQAGMDLDALLQAQSFAKQLAGLRLWGEPDPENGGEPFEPCGGMDDSHLCLMGLIGQARTLACLSAH